MKVKIPVWQLKENISGVHIDRINHAFISSLFDDISKLHRNDHFICVMLISGNAELQVDFKNARIAPEKLAFLFPGQIQQAVKFDNADGWILFLDNKLVDEHARMMIEDSLVKGPLLSLSAPDFLWFNRYFELLFQTYNDHTLGSLHKPAVNAFVAPGVYKIASAFQANTDAGSGHHSQRSIELTKKFKRLVRKHYRDLKKPGDYAGLMSFSLSYLNDTIKSVTGFTTSYFIQQEMLREGQRLLCYTDLSIKEIATYLGYEDPKYFNRMFTKLAAISPGRFRNNFKTQKKLP
ncbi:helix-turn-helix domain-containing protein [Chitinophaga barathri]|uniref:AraC family transcriptional regulator n=1 Tax=Chitinophaga barathri TaxID=1647451 RepID=A0A3N4MCR8_9BACT|nr:AraC family transcriptional regulator [Chitinophaga barathri]RPD41501.1 AraC family transcriptional regulator [Chitinophaga barathri]